MSCLSLSSFYTSLSLGHPVGDHALYICARSSSFSSYLSFGGQVKKAVAEEAEEEGSIQKVASGLRVAVRGRERVEMGGEREREMDRIKRLRDPETNGRI